MYIHKEGFKTILLSLILFVLLQSINVLFLRVFMPYAAVLLFVVFCVVLGLIIWFFRIPKRVFTVGTDLIVAPADGTIVAIEDVQDAEYIKGKCLQVSIFMSPLNVHVNRYPISGAVVYSKYHPGKYLMAAHPKSSTQNERHSIVIQKGEKKILVKQIAGALARRIVNYAGTGMTAVQNEELGFIKFGSRVDLLLPLGTPLQVALKDKVRGGVSIIGHLN